jgi:adenylate kinase
VKGYLDAGGLVPDELTIELVRSGWPSRTSRDGFLLDGFRATSGRPTC